MIISFIKGKVIQTVFHLVLYKQKWTELDPRTDCAAQSCVCNNRQWVVITVDESLISSHEALKVWKLNESFKTVTETFCVM